LDSLFSTYWGENDNLLDEEEFSESYSLNSKKSLKKNEPMLQVKKTLKSSRGSRRARMILEKVQSKKQP